VRLCGNDRDLLPPILYCACHLVVIAILGMSDGKRRVVLSGLGGANRGAGAYRRFRRGLLCSFVIPVNIRSQYEHLDWWRWRWRGRAYT
jgi:hypothetical protein